MDGGLKSSEAALSGLHILVCSIIVVLHKRKGRWLHVLSVHLRTAFLPTINAAGLSITSDVAITASNIQGRGGNVKDGILLPTPCFLLP